MEGSVCKVKVVLKKCQLAYVTLFLKQFTEDRREASVSISSRQSADVVTITPQQLHYLHNKIQKSQIDGVIDISDWLSVASYEIKLYKYECGTLFLLEFRNCRVKINQEVVNALIYVKQRIHSFIFTTSGTAAE